MLRAIKFFMQCFFAHYQQRCFARLLIATKAQGMKTRMHSSLKSCSHVWRFAAKTFSMIACNHAFIGPYNARVSGRMRENVRPRLQL